MKNGSDIDTNLAVVDKLKIFTFYKFRAFRGLRGGGLELKVKGRFGFYFLKNGSVGH